MTLLACLVIGLASGHVKELKMPAPSALVGEFYVAGTFAVNRVTLNKDGSGSTFQETDVIKSDQERPKPRPGKWVLTKDAVVMRFSPGEVWFIPVRWSGVVMLLKVDEIPSFVLDLKEAWKSKGGAQEFFWVGGHLANYLHRDVSDKWKPGPPVLEVPKKWLKEFGDLGSSRKEP